MLTLLSMEKQMVECNHASLIRLLHLSVIWFYTVCHSVCIFLMHKYMVKPGYSNFKIIMAIFSRVQFYFFFFFTFTEFCVFTCGFPYSSSFGDCKYRDLFSHDDVFHLLRTRLDVTKQLQWFEHNHSFLFTFHKQSILSNCRMKMLH